MMTKQRVNPSSSAHTVAAPTPFAQVILEQDRILRDAVIRFDETAAGEVRPVAAQWLLDNYYVVQQTLRQIREDMPPGFYRRLALLTAGELAGYPRIYALARDMLAAENIYLDAEAMQRISDRLRNDPALPQPLSMAEVWALPVMLRLCNLQALAQTVCRINAQQCKQSWPEMPAPADLRNDDIVANAVLSLRTLAAHDWRSFFEAVSRVEHLLREDPAGAYAGMDEETRDRYRKVVERLARASGKAETLVAEAVVALAREAAGAGASARQTHIGYYLIDDGRPVLERRIGYRAAWPLRARRWARQNPTLFYLGSILVLTLMILLTAVSVAERWGGSMLQQVWIVALALVPASTVAVGMVNWAVTLLMPPRVLPKMDFARNIPDEFATLIVIPALLGSAAEVRSLLRQIELHYLRNSGQGLSFALLTDFTDAPEQHLPGDEALLRQAANGIRALNQRHAGAGRPLFWLLHRERRWNANDARWMGWERKRGKLHELNRLLRGAADTSFMLDGAGVRALHGVRYVITLDADTILPPHEAHRLIGTLAHPMNRAVFGRRGRVVSGYTLLQPRTEITPASAKRSIFTRIFAGDVGLDLYTRAVSNVYQDLFGAGIFIGKGIYDVDAFERSLAGRVPENALLSHDLFEGIHGRVGLVTDIVLFEEYPPHYLVYVRRSHRWIRGDWQLLPWLFPRVPRAGAGRVPNPLSIIDRWKILDNLRRSLLAPALLALLVAAWMGLPGPAWGWTLFAMLTPAVPVLTGAFSTAMQAIAERRRHAEKGSYRGAILSLRDGVLRWLLELVFLPYETLLSLGSIAITLVRLFVTRRNMLEWVTAAQAAREGGHEVSRRVVQRRMVEALAVTLVLGLLILTFNPPALPVALPFLLAWMLSPEIAYFISQPRPERRETLTPADHQLLRKLARRTWLFFEQYVGPEDHWLPPDHFQEAPLGQVVSNTSPTNIGLMFLSALSACDMGYISAPELLTRVRLGFDTLDRLEMHRGHWLNWYDTRTLQPLAPRYVSTVDSGNLAGCLIALRQGLRELRFAHVLRQAYWEGWLDTLDMLADAVEAFYEAGLQQMVTELRADFERVRNRVQANKHDPAMWLQLYQSTINEDWPAFYKRLLALVEAGVQMVEPKTLHWLRLSVDRARSHLENARRDLEKFLPAEVRQHTSAYGLTYAGLADLCEQAQAALPAGDAHEAPLKSAGAAAQEILADIAGLEARAAQYVERMDFSFLFDHERQLFRIGYNVENARLDANYYDLLASEARIAGLVAIAKSDAPPTHWLHLGRPFTEVAGTRCLLSWSATMFEYLMPALLLRSLDGTLMHESSRAAVHRQIDYARERGVPWGISESGYYAFDAAQNYQYRAFGVPGLGFKRELADDLVIAPYASLLALPIAPRAVVENVRRLMSLDALGAYGLYEAVDYTPARMPLGQSRAVVQEYMAHHQGMILVALANHLLGEPMVNRCHADPHVQSVELLLQERIPYNAPLEPPQVDEILPPAPVNRPVVNTSPWRVPAIASAPRVHVLSNGRMTTLITSAGSGVCRWNELDLTRWQPDPTLEPASAAVYVQEISAQGELGPIWSTTHQPAGMPAHGSHVEFAPHLAEFHSRVNDLAITMQVAVAPDDDVEIRRVMLTNHSDAPRTLRLSSYAEMALAPHADVLRHPAFSKLFVESEFIAGQNALLFRRRPRSQAEAAGNVIVAHAAVAQPGESEVLRHETSRAAFIGRNGDLRSPQILSEGEPAIPRDGLAANGASAAPAQPVETPLDPIASINLGVVLQPHQSVEVAFLMLVAPTRQKALRLTERYSAWHMIDLAFNQAQSRAQSELMKLGMGSDELTQAEQLLSAMLYPMPGLRAPSETLAANEKGQNGLWAFGISGDYPIVLLRLDEADDLSLAQDVLKAHTFWRNRQLKIDLVILNQQGSNYTQELGGVLQRLLVRMNSDHWINRRGGIYVLNADQMGESDRVLLETTARAIIDPARGTLARQLEALWPQQVYLPQLLPTGSYYPGASGEPADALPPIARPDDLQFDNGAGGFSADGREYVIYLRPGWHTPAPWVNVIANPEFGCIVSETGASYTWAGNSSENRLTPWSNDPVSDPTGEALYLRDEETVEVWSPLPAPCPAQKPYLIRHGAGYSTFEHHSLGLRQQVTVFVAPDAPVKLIRLRLENASARTRRITATYFAEWVLGATREAMQMFVTPAYDSETQALLARNPYNAEFGGRVAFAVASKPLHGLTADRAEFLGRAGDPRRPEALHRVGLSGRVEPGLDPCATLQVHLDLAPGQVEEVHFVLGQGANREEALALARQYKDDAQAEAALKAARQGWDALLGCVQVKTPEPAMDLLLNRWLLYQSLSSRIWGRTALYQSSGAFGFRDQLQDVMALMHAAPQLAREHILSAARHQFEAGDVLHWWHPPSGRGVRTRCSDDLLWLPFVTAHYIAGTGDLSILEERMPFLRAQPLREGEEERYSVYAETEETFTLFEHCQRALRAGSTAGAHGLPLMGSGDWNDGMNRVGIEGRGESVWLGWFLHATLTRFAEVCAQAGHDDDADALREQAGALAAALERHAWDGNWYRRAYYDDGTPLGSAESDECQIDSIAQSWAAISGAGDPARAQLAMRAVMERLVKPDAKLVLLFTPPFDKTMHDPGYIKGYVPGIRENGGQYTHAAIWVSWALAQMGDGDQAEAVFRLLNPIHHSDTAQAAGVYKVEPYVIAADVYGVPPHTGRGGWTWYTGSAAWFYRLGLEAILGVRRRGDALCIEPRIPRAWPGFSITFRFGETIYKIEVLQHEGVAGAANEVTLDDAPIATNQIPLRNDGGRHHVRVRLVVPAIIAEAR